MKIRNGFVSNSSSSCFYIYLKNLKDIQLQQIVDHSTWGKILKMDYPEDKWEIVVGEDVVTGFTFMDNFDMFEFLKEIGVDPENISMDKDG
jgi:hypothetical protein